MRTTVRRALITTTLGTGLTLAAVLACATGCERAASKKAIVLNPAPRPTATTTTVAAPATRPTPATKTSATQAAVKKASFMLVNQQWVEFPEAKLVIKRDGEHLTAFLTSNDPPEVLSPAYQGNRYYFELRLDTTAEKVPDLALAEFRYKAPSAGPADSPNGIFLDGDRQHLQPYDIQVVFDKDGPDKTLAVIRGQFLYFPKGQLVGQMVPIQATLSTKAETK